MNDQERALQDQLAAKLLGADPASRDAAYREVYEAFHAYLGGEGGRKSFLYRKQPWARSSPEVRLVGSGHDNVLEMGCGEGWLTLVLAAANRHVIGVDISDRCIEACRRNQQAHGADNVEFHRQSGVKLAWPDGTFDAAVSTEFLEHLHPDDVPTHLAEVRRVLKPGGRYVVVTPNRHRHHDDDGDGTLHLRLYAYEDLAELFRTAGFAQVLAPFLKTSVLVNARHKIRLERVFLALGWRSGWGGTGLSSVVLCGIAPAAEHAAVQRREFSR